MKIYTKAGDKGQTSLVGGKRIAKSHPRLDVYGTVDELNSAIGVLAAYLRTDSAPELQVRIAERLTRIQNNLFNLGSRLACEDSNLLAQLPRPDHSLVQELEKDMDQWDQELPQLRNFILPGGTVAASFSHLARTICRRAEREAVKLAGLESQTNYDDAIVFLNRLSDWFFVLARKLNHAAGLDDVQWQKG